MDELINKYMSKYSEILYSGDLKKLGIYDFVYVPTTQFYVGKLEYLSNDWSPCSQIYGNCSRSYLMKKIFLLFYAFCNNYFETHLKCCNNVNHKTIFIYFFCKLYNN